MTARRMTLLAMLAGTVMIALPVWNPPAIRVIWNASASVPLDDLAGFLDERRYLPRGLPLLKRVLALSGTTVCRNGAEITAYGMTYGQARERDGQGRPLPVWQGCRTLRADEAFFMNWESPDSFDGRYFGPLPLSTVVGRAIPLWTTDDPDPVVETFREPVSDEP